ncbi:MAG: hypothetical protein HY744_15585 [Deltaproteobacteria bacterium]|nr:hypothetical protein [Deltaproteobacteria bacterium]
MRPRTVRSRLPLGFALALALLATRAHAQPETSGTGRDRAAARALAGAGFALFQAGDYARAIERLRAAEQIVHAPTHVLYLARALAKLGKLAEAREQYRRVADEVLAKDGPAAFRQAQAEARQELAALAARIPAVRIAVQCPAAAASAGSVDIDGKPVGAAELAGPIQLDPGEHRIRARAPRCGALERTVQLREGGAQQVVSMTLGPADGEPPAAPGQAPGGLPLPVPALALLGAGIVGVGVGTVAGVLAIDKASELKDRCPSNPCPPENEDLADSATALAHVSTVGFAVGIAAAGAGVLWWLFAPGASPAGPDPAAAGAAVRPWIGVGEAGLRASF